MANPYLQVLRTPHALPMVLAAFIGRLPLSMVGLGCVLLVAAETGSYGLGGAVAAVDVSGADAALSVATVAAAIAAGVVSLAR